LSPRDRRPPRRGGGKLQPPARREETGRTERVPLARSQGGQHAHRRGASASEPPFRRPSPDVVVLYGFHAVSEALIAGKRKLLSLFATESGMARIASEAQAAGVEPHLVEAQDLTKRLGAEAIHQGLLLEARPLPEADILDIESKTGVILVLDQITDPHNVGAILRTAGAFAVDALITTERHSPDFSGVLAKAASGALEHVTIVSVVNLARALEQLRDAGYVLAGLDSEGEKSLEEIALRKPLALVLGAEGRGLRRLTRDRCDVVARLDMPGAIKSLNVSNACAVALSILRGRLA
jgi:23S rRNA (guanosine2251-2'-O)-methyltransferase